MFLILATLIIARLIAGTFGSSPLANAGGTLADIWMVHSKILVLTTSHMSGERRWLFLPQRPSLDLSSGQLLVGSYRSMVYLYRAFSLAVSWRWTFWLSLIYAGVVMTDIAIFLPETYTKALLIAKARKLRKETGNPNLYCESEKNKQSVYDLYKVSLSRYDLCSGVLTLDRG
jgi:MFS family permease